MAQRQFYIYFMNDDAHTFNVRGPVSSDLRTGELTNELLAYGLKVHISTSNDAVMTLSEAQLKGPEGYKLDHKLGWLKD